MKKMWAVMRYEYSRHVFRRRFWISLLSVPAMLAAIFLVTFLLVRSKINDKPIGYVDQSGVLAQPVPAPAPQPPDRPLEMIAFTSEQTARQALQEGKTQAYYVLDPDYLETGKARLVVLNEVNPGVNSQFINFLRANLLSSEPPAVARRIIEGDQLVVENLDGTRTASANDIFSVFVPALAGLAFMIAVFTTSGYLMQTVVEEKENRTMEVLITSLSPGQLMTGKIIGNIGVGSTQLLVWLVVALVVILVGRHYVEWMRMIRLPAETILLLLGALLPAFVMIGALMAALGATVTEAREGQQISGLLTLPIFIPYYFVGLIIENPNSPLSVALSFFPLTAPVTLAIRVGVAAIPTWQIITNMAVEVLAALGAVWLAGRAFRLGMLQYGQRLPWRRLFGRAGG